MNRLLVAPLVVAISVPAHAVVFCTAKTGSGTIRIRPACKKNESQLDPVALGLKGEPGPKGDPGAKGDAAPEAPRVVVRDATGALVGAVIGPTFAPVDPPPWPASYPSDGLFRGGTPVARRIGGTVVQFSVDAHRVLTGPNLVPDTLTFDSTDCSGPARVLVDPSALMSMAWMEGDGVHYATLPGSSRSFRSIAFFVTAGSPCNFTPLPTGRCCRGDLEPNNFRNQGDVLQLDEAALGVVPPFHVEGP